MTKKGAFDQSFSDSVDFGDTMDINQILDNLPALDVDDDNSDDDVDNKKKKNDDDDDVSLDINKVLDAQNAGNDDDNDGDGDDDSDDTDDDNKDIDGSPAPDNIKSSSSDAPFAVIFARDLMEQGLLSNFDEEEYLKEIEEHGQANALRNLIRTEVETNIEAAKSDLDEGYQQYLTLVGKGVDSGMAASLLTLQERFNGIDVEALEDEDSVDLRKSVLTDYYRMTTQLSDSKIEKLVQRSIDLGDDVADAKENLAVMQDLVNKQIEEEKKTAEKNKALQIQENQRRLDSLKDTINAINEIIPGQTINKQTKVKLYDLITKPIVDKDGRTTNALWAKRAEDPSTFDAKLAYLVETGFFEKDKPWTKIKSVKVSKEASALEEALNKKNNTVSRTGRSFEGDVHDDNIKEIIKQTRSILNK